MTKPGCSIRMNDIQETVILGYLDLLLLILFLQCFISGVYLYNQVAEVYSFSSAIACTIVATSCLNFDYPIFNVRLGCPLI